MCRSRREFSNESSFRKHIAIPTHIYLQNLASIQPRTSSLKFVGSRDAAAPAVLLPASERRRRAEEARQPMPLAPPVFLFGGTWWNCSLFLSVGSRVPPGQRMWKETWRPQSTWILVDSVTKIRLKMHQTFLSTFGIVLFATFCLIPFASRDPTSPGRTK